MLWAAQETMLYANLSLYFAASWPPTRDNAIHPLETEKKKSKINIKSFSLASAATLFFVVGRYNLQTKLATSCLLVIRLSK